jgi:hypothetical protein
MGTSIELGNNSAVLYHRDPRSGPLRAHKAQEDFVCWTKMQAEAGQPIETIVLRKELERQAGNGIFMWGVGNAPALLINTLARLEQRVPVVFSLMKSKPKAIDVAPPAGTLVWRRYIDSNGYERDIPSHIVITSRGAEDWPNKRHYALMCYSASPLRIVRGLGFDHHAYRNASGVGAPVGASQVTSLLRRVGWPSDDAEYEANLSADLTQSYWVKLTDPALLSAKQTARLAGMEGLDSESWRSLAEEIRTGTSSRRGRGSDRLFV